MKKILFAVIVCLLVLGAKAQIPGGTLLYNFDMSDANAITAINGEPDSVSFYPESNTSWGQFTDANGVTYGLQRNCSIGLHLYTNYLLSTIKDGMPDNGDGYGRSEVTLYGYEFTIDTNHIYTLEWKGYLPVGDTNYLTSWYSILLAMQIHGGTQVPTVWGLNLGSDGSIYSGDVYDDYSGTDYGKGPGLYTVNDTIGTFSGWYNTPHTIRVTLKEGKGYPGQDAFFHIQIDGHTVYYRNSGQVGSSYWDDYVKFGGLYDWNNAMVDITNYTRGRRFSLVTDSYKVYQVTADLADDASPTYYGPFGLNCKCTIKQK